MMWRRAAAQIRMSRSSGQCAICAARVAARHSARAGGDSAVGWQFVEHSARYDCVAISPLCGLEHAADSRISARARSAFITPCMKRDMHPSGAIRWLAHGPSRWAKIRAPGDGRASRKWSAGSISPIRWTQRNCESIATPLIFHPMIRRRGKGYWLLIAQNDHAQLSGELAARIGNDQFAAARGKSDSRGIGMHDTGWPTHDENPTLNSTGLPTDVFQMPREAALPIWAASAKAAVAADPYAGLLVSLHSLALSAMPAPAPPEKFESAQMKQRFETNKFQHKQIEEQEGLRRQLGMRTDIPLTLGLATAELERMPVRIRCFFDFRWLQTMDQLSLFICCTDSPPLTPATVDARPGEAPSRLNFSHLDPMHVSVSPWPFGEAELSCSIEGRIVPDVSPGSIGGDFPAGLSHCARLSRSK